MFTSKVQFKVLGYLTGDGENGSVPKIIRKQNSVNVTVSRERVIGRSIGIALRTVASDVIEKESTTETTNDQNINNEGNKANTTRSDDYRPEDEFNLGGERSEPDGGWDNLGPAAKVKPTEEEEE